MSSIITESIKCLYKAAANTIKHDGIEHAGYMAFLSLLSLFPFLIFVMVITGFVGASGIGTKFIHIMLDNLPNDITTALNPRIQEILSGPPQGLMTLAIIGIIWTASSAVEGLRTILNRVYRVQTLPPYIFRRLLSIVQFLVLVGIIIIAMLLFIVIPIIVHKLSLITLISGKLFHIIDIISALISSFSFLRYIILYITLVLVVAGLYFIIPNIRLKSIYVFPGAILVVLLWFIGGYILTLYISHFKQVNIVYGSLGGIIIALLFFYIINMIFIYGAEFNYLFGNLIENYRKNGSKLAQY